MISIVMPVKNASPFLATCIDSILEQTEMDWELIAVDDHSDDNSMEILDIYREKDHRISCFSNDKQGIINALNQAYQHSRGDFIHRMDADDIMPKEKLQKLKAKLLSVGKGHVVTANVKYFGAEDISEGYQDYENWINGLCQGDTHWKHIYQECVIASPCWMIYRDDFDSCGGFNSDIYPEDYDLVFRFYKNRLKVKSINEVLHLWREHPNRTSRNHPNYNQEAFFRLKLHYFLELERNRTKELVIIGAGIKGKMVHEILDERKESHHWIGQKNSEKTIEKIRTVVTDKSKQLILLFSDKKSKNDMNDYLKSLDMRENSDYFFFR